MKKEKVTARLIDQRVRKLCLEKHDAEPEDLTHEQLEPIIEKASGEICHEYDLWHEENN